jgi:hypothetical protein
MKPVAIATIEETVGGLFGAADMGGGVTMWCRRRHVLERHEQRADGQWRPMEMEDVRRLHAVGAIDRACLDRMEIRLLR